MTIRYYAVHSEDVKWMIGEPVSMCNHAFMFSGYELGGMAELAALHGLKLVCAEGSIFDTKEKIIKPVIG